MKEIKNEKTISNYAVDGMRDICCRRAATIAYMMDEAAKEGLSDEFARKAMRLYGRDRQIEAMKKWDEPGKFAEYARRFGTGAGKEVYEMEILERSEKRLAVNFHYCPYVEAWLKQGRTPEEIEHLCDVTMEGDRGAAEQVRGCRFTLPKTIAAGDGICALRFEYVGEDS